MGDLELQRLFKFNEADLSANRLGELTERQRARLLQELRSGKILALRSAGVIALILSGLSTLLLALRGSLAETLPSAVQKIRLAAGLTGEATPPTLEGTLSVLAPVLLLVGLALFFFSQRAARTLEFQVQRAEGLVSFGYVDKQLRNPGGASTPYQDIQVLEMRVGENDRFFDVSERLPDHIQQGARYTFYYCAHPFRILSAERLGKVE